jgi:hypothetical protein
MIKGETLGINKQQNRRFLDLIFERTKAEGEN